MDLSGNIKVGNSINGQQIKKIYSHNKEKGYIILLTEENYITALAKKQTEIQKFNEINNEKLAIYELNLNEDEKKSYCDSIANAIYHALNHDTQVAKDMLIKIREKIIKNKCRMKKMTYTAIYLSLVVLSILLSLIVHIFFDSLLKFVSMDILYIQYATTFAVIGSFISTIFELDKIDISDEYNNMNILNVLISYFVAILSGIITFTVIKSKMFLGFIEGTPSLSVILLFAVISGFSEKFIPNTLKKVENSIEQEI